MQAVREVAQPLPLEELARRHLERRVPDRAVAITFDDGYQDNLYTAKPLLERHDVPATVFITTGEAGRSTEFWWDELQRILLGAPKLPPRLTLDAPGLSLHVDFGSWAQFAGPSAEGWTVLDNSTPTLRHAALRAMYESLRDMHVAQQRAVLDQLRDWAEMDREVRPTHRALDAEEMIALQDGGLITIGAHTVNHPALNMQPGHVQREEVSRSKSDLESILGREVAGFAYPYGLYTRESVDAVRSAGFSFGCACWGHTVRRSSGRFELPRIDAPDGDGDALARLLEDAFGA
jgi:peptidoglycan/xylan/chitin deacetylase (PgdA/CDA1 family)